MKKSICPFSVAFFCGVLLANFFGLAVGRELGAMNEYFMNRYLYAEIQGRELFLYLFYQRVPGFLLLLILSLGAYGALVGKAYLSYLGFSAGFLAVISIMNEGIRGVLLLAGFFLPQWLLYIPAIWVWYKEICQCGQERHLHLGVFLPALASFFLLCGGILLESYGNPWLLWHILGLL